MNLTEKYRPKKLTEIVGQPRAVNMLNRLKPGGRAFYITGPSGTGKTSIAKIIARQVADQLYIREVVARQLKASDLKDFTDQWATTTMFGSGYAMIINESHGLRRDIVEILLDVLERLPDNCSMIFTTTRDGADLFEERQIDAGPFASRCILVNLVTYNKSRIFAAYLRRIAKQENLNGRPLNDYMTLIEKHHYNLRAAIQEIETGAMMEPKTKQLWEKTIREATTTTGNLHHSRFKGLLDVDNSRIASPTQKRIANKLFDAIQNGDLMTVDKIASQYFHRAFVKGNVQGGPKDVKQPNSVDVTIGKQAALGQQLLREYEEAKKSKRRKSSRTTEQYSAAGRKAAETRRRNARKTK